jgi:hypothetical protein
MRSPGYAFIAGLVYSLTSSTQLLSPDGPFAWREFWGARRIYLTAVWDDTPHLAAVSLLPLIVLFLSLSMSRRKPVYYAAAAVVIALAALASAFGPTDTFLAAFCLLFVLHRERLPGNIGLVTGIGTFAWALTAPFYSPEMITAIRESSGRDGTGWSTGSYTAIALVILGWALLWHFLKRRTQDWRVRFFALWAYLMSAIPMLGQYLGRQFLPQPTRYRLEMEMAIVVLAVFALKPCIQRLPLPIRTGLLFTVLALAGEQIESERKFAKAVLLPTDVPKMIESRASLWAERNLPGVRISMPGSIAQWSTLFAPVQEFTGGAWNLAYNAVQQRASDGVINFEDSRKPLLWLKAYGVGAICVPGPKSPEFWKALKHPEKFDALPVLWQEDDTKIVAIPRRGNSLAHVVPEGVIVSEKPRDQDDIARVERYVAALDDPALPDAAFRWEGNNRIVIQAPAASANAISVQVSWHPGWHASVDGRKAPLAKDGLGLMWLKPQCTGPCEIRLDYDGGWLLRLMRWISFFAMATLIAGLPWLAFRRRKLI